MYPNSKVWIGVSEWGKKKKTPLFSFWNCYKIFFWTRKKEGRAWSACFHEQWKIQLDHLFFYKGPPNFKRTRPNWLPFRLLFYHHKIGRLISIPSLVCSWNTFLANFSTKINQQIVAHICCVPLPTVGPSRNLPDQNFRRWLLYWYWHLQQMLSWALLICWLTVSIPIPYCEIFPIFTV